MGGVLSPGARTLRPEGGAVAEGPCGRSAGGSGRRSSARSNDSTGRGCIGERALAARGHERGRRRPLLASLGPEQVAGRSPLARGTAPTSRGWVPASLGPKDMRHLCRAGARRAFRCRHLRAGARARVDPFAAARNLRKLCVEGGHIVVSTPFLIRVHELHTLWDKEKTTGASPRRESGNCSNRPA